jgi:REP element-mobilizing transposase RayT
LRLSDKAVDLLYNNVVSKSTQPLVIAHHVVWTLYGWWLPNDPRGSTSRTIRNDLVAELGELHLGRKAVQPAGRQIREFYVNAKAALQHPLLSFAVDEFSEVAAAIGNAVTRCNYTCYACAVMPDHVHLVIRKHRDLGEVMIDKIQTLSRERLVELGLREAGHPVWTRGGWKVFLDHPDDVQRTIRYVEANPVKIGLPPQNWPCVRKYDNWPLHAGHSPNSPYVRALRAAGRYPR